MTYTPGLWPRNFLYVGICIILLCFKELMVEINIIGFHLIQFTGRNQGFYKQGVEFVCCIEIVGLALIRSIGDVILFSSLMALRMVSELHVRSIG